MFSLVKIAKKVQFNNLFKNINETLSVALNSKCNLSKKVNKNDDDDKDDHLYQRDETTGIKNLMEIDKVKPYMSWPQYNRIIYPPPSAENPDIIRNPVC
jgi:hypothetical protein